MVYTNPQIDESFEALDHPYPNGYRPVKIVYNGSGIHMVTGPVPTITFGRQTNKNDTGYLHSIPVSINLAGTIFRNNVDTGLDPTGTGIKTIFKAIDNLKRIFLGWDDSATTFTGKDRYNGVLEVKCGGSTHNDGETIFAATGVRLTNFNADRSDNNWVFSAEYSIDLEYFEYKPDSSGFFIKSCNDSWSVEPLEEYTYTNFMMPVTQRSEYHNPLMQPAALTLTNKFPAPIVGSQQEIGTAQLNVFNIPRYKISRQLSAVGLPVGTGNTATGSAFEQAKKWVLSRMHMTYDKAVAESGTVLLTNGSNLNTGSLLPLPTGFNYLYNHLKTTNFSISAGSYEVSETWLAMPTGLKYLEDYTIDCSTDEKFVKTVRIQGDIQGLHLNTISEYTGAYPVLADVSQNDGANIISLDESLETMTKQTNKYTRTDFPLSDQGIAGANGALPPNSNQIRFQDSKYQNALSGWVYEIKPFIYRRACLLTTATPDKNSQYINPAIAANRSIPPLNPVYCSDRPLNIIPISTSETHNPRKGTISYSHEFTNKFMFLSGVVSENVSINDTNPAEVIAESFVLGRRLGPVLQNLGARTSAKRDISIDIQVVPPTSIGGFFLNNTECPVYTGGVVWSGLDVMIEGLKPYGDRPTNIFGNFSKREKPINDQGQVYKLTDTHSWSPTDGKLSRTVGWVYQPCTNTRPVLDN